MRSGQVIDERFEIERLVGRGGMGQVFRAFDRHRGQPVALKTLTRLDGAAEDRFTREALVLAELQHPGIVRYVAHGRCDDEQYLVMEWLEGEDLDSLLQGLRDRFPPARMPDSTEATLVDGAIGSQRPDDTSSRGAARVSTARHGETGVEAASTETRESAQHRQSRPPSSPPPPGLTVNDALCVARRIAGALSELHRHGIVHRDVKPSNVYLVDGMPAHAKLLDFGTARATTSVMKLTSTGMLIGTPSYMSPEQAEGSNNVGPATDVWSLGCVLYECLAGKPPFEAAHALALLARIVADEPEPLSRLRDDVPVALETVLRRMLQKEQGRRFSNAHGVVEALSTIDVEGGGGRRGVLGFLGGSEAANAQTQLSSDHSARRTRSSRPGLTTNEARVLSLLLARGSAQSHAALPSDERFRLEAAIVDCGCELSALADGFGSLMILPKGSRAPKEQAANLARAALALRRAAPQLSFVLTTGRAQPQGHLPAGDLVDQAVSQLLRVPSGEVRVDAESSALLGTRFELERTPSGERLLAERRSEAARTLLGKPTLWVGRQRELALLFNTFEECASDSVARALLVTASAGVGKTRLRHEFIAALQQAGKAAQILYCQGDSLSAGSPFVMVGPAIRRSAQIQDGEALDSRRAKLRERILGSVPPEHAERVAAFVGEMAGVPFDDANDESLRAARKDPMLLGELMRSAFIDWLSAECNQRTVLLVMEDLHWGDLPSVQYVDAALAALRDAPFMVLALARPEIHELYPKLWDKRDLQALRLHGLSKRASLELVRHMLGDHIDEATAETIAKKADGNAFYLEELIRFAVEGRLGEVPENVLGMVQTRLGGLDQEARRVLRAASIFGEVFFEDGVRELLGEEAKTFDLGEWLTHLISLELVRERQEARLPGQRELQFRHALVRDAAYEMLTEEDRTLGHRLAGTWLVGAGEQDPLVLGEHFSRGGDHAAAVAWFQRAAEQAFDGNDLDGVLGCVERAVAAGAGGTTLGALRALQSQALYWKSEYSEAKAAGERAVELLPAGSDTWFKALGSSIVSAARAGDTASVRRFFQGAMQAECQPDAQAAQLICLCRGTFQLIFSAEFEQADLALLRIAEVAGDMVGLDALTVAQVHHVRGVRAAHVGNVATFLRHLEAAVAAFERAGDTRNVSLERTTVAWCYAEIGQCERAKELCEASLAYCESLGAQQAVTYARVNLGYILMLCPDSRDRAVQTLERAIRECQAVHNPRLEGWARAHLASLEYCRARYPESEVHARIAEERLAAAPGLQAWARSARSRALLSLERKEEALALARQSMLTLESLGGLLQGESLPPLALAECLLADGRSDAALAALADAHARLVQRTERLENREWQRTFLELPDNVRTEQLFREHVRKER